jgi:hypothetical protein
MYIYMPNSRQAYEGLGQLGQSEINQAISMAKKQMKIHSDLQAKYTAGAGKTNDRTAAHKEFEKHGEWMRELDFLEKLKAVYESQAGVPLGYALYRSPPGSSLEKKCNSYRDSYYTLYPVTKKDPITGMPGEDNPWRPSKRREKFCKSENDGSFCLGASRAMAFRIIFGLGRPSNRAVLTDLKKKIEAAEASEDTDVEARLIISRIVSHSYDRGSVKQFNDDLPSRYGIKNTIVRSATRSEAFDALKQGGVHGAPVIADLEGGWHWVMVHRSPRKTERTGQGQLWANDPLSGSGIREISSSALGSRFELIVDAKTGDPITPYKAGAYMK